MTRVLLRLYLRPDSPIGPGKIQLLEGIRDRGSISAAARSMKMSYRSAWMLIDSMNGLFRSPVVRTTLGGPGGGAATLTPFGAEVIARFRAMEAASRRAISRDLASLERRLSGPAARRSGPARRPRR